MKLDAALRQALIAECETLSVALDADIEQGRAAQLQKLEDEIKALRETLKEQDETFKEKSRDEAHRRWREHSRLRMANIGKRRA